MVAKREDLKKKITDWDKFGLYSYIGNDCSWNCGEAEQLQIVLQYPK